MSERMVGDDRAQAPPRGVEPAVPKLRGRRARLEAVAGSHNVEFARRLLSDQEVASRYRFANAVPSPSEVERALWERALAQFVLIDQRDDRRVGLCQLTNAVFRHGTANIAVVIEPDSRRKPWVLEGVALFVEYAFGSFPLRKLYGEVVEFNLAQFASGRDRLFVEEGRLRDHEWHFGRYWDVSILSVSREAWLGGRHRQRLIQRHEAGS